MKRVLIIGGYGNFGSYIARTLAAEENLRIIIAGRSADKCRTFIEQLNSAKNAPEYAVLDITDNLPQRLRDIKPDIVIHTSGPFQAQGYDVASACIEEGCHYIDLADGRDFVAHIDTQDAAAKSKGVTVISGASSVPCLTAALIDEYMPQFGHILSVDYGITTAQRTNTGLATTTAILNYTGKKFKTKLKGKMRDIVGWQGLALRRYPELGMRLLGYCDIPDLALFPQRYPQIDTFRFRAGSELAFLHLGLWGLSWLVRLGLMKSLAPYAEFLLKTSRRFDRWGSDTSGFHMEIKGKSADGTSRTQRIFIIAKSGHGPFIPCTPAILCAKKLANGTLAETGAFPCIGIISRQEYLDALKGLDILVIETTLTP